MNERQDFEALIAGSDPETQAHLSRVFNIGFRAGVEAALDSVSASASNIKRRAMRGLMPVDRQGGVPLEHHNLEVHHGLEGIPENHGMPFTAWIDELDLGIRAYNTLKRGGIHTVGELLSMSLEELRNIRNFGPKVELEVVCKLDEFDYRLQGDDPNRKRAVSTRRKYLEGIPENHGMPFDAPIEKLGLKPHTQRILMRNSINTVEQLLVLPLWQLTRFIGFGKVSKRDVDDRLATFGYSVYNGVMLLSN